MQLLYTTDRQVRALKHGPECKLRHFLKVNADRITKWALYRDHDDRGREFHNATDPNFLVDHDDPYWRAVLGCESCDEEECWGCWRERETWWPAQKRLAEEV